MKDDHRYTIRVPRDIKVRLEVMAKSTGFKQSDLILMAAYAFCSYYAEKGSFTYADLFITNQNGQEVNNTTLSVALPPSLRLELERIAKESSHFNLKSPQLIITSLSCLIENFEVSGSASFLHLVSPDYRRSGNSISFPKHTTPQQPEKKKKDRMKTKIRNTDSSIIHIVELLETHLKGQYKENYNAIAELLLPLTVEQREEVIVAMKQSRLIRKPVAWTRSAIDRGFKPEKTVSEVPPWINNQNSLHSTHVERVVDIDMQISALDLLKQLGEIDDAEYDRRYRKIYEHHESASIESREIT